MSRMSVFVYIFLLCMLTVPVYGQHHEDMFDDTLISAYDQARALNESKNYLEAYRRILSVERTMDSFLSQKGVKACVLSEYDYRYVYWPIKKSKAEIAYMLGLYSDMDAVSVEMQESLGKRTWEEDDAVQAVIDGLWADIAKIDGSRYYLIEKYDSAETALMRALQLKPYENIFVCPVHGDLAQLYYKQERYEDALKQLDAILDNPLYNGNSRDSGSETDKQEILSQRAICLARLGRYAEALYVIEPVLTYYKRGTDKRAYAEALRKKAKILMLQYDATSKYNPAAKRCYQEYLAISRDFIDSHFVSMSESEREQYWMAEQPFVTDCFRLEDKAPELLYDVALYSKAVLLQMGRDFKQGMTVAERRRALSSIRVGWQDVKAKLPAAACAIEYIVYEKKGKSHLGAVVVDKKKSAPFFVDLGNVSAISDMSLTDSYTVKDVFADTQSKDKINALYNSEELRSKVWNAQLVEAISGCETVYFSPDGIFHQMGIEYMIPQSLEKTNFYRLTTTRLLTTQNHGIRTDNMLVCGGVDYGFSVDDIETGNDELAYSLLAPMDLRITPLPNSSVEIDSIHALRSKHPSDMVLRADSVTESALANLLGKYHILHISTHGLFSEVSKMGTDIRPSSSDTQLSKSCLFLSGSDGNLRQQNFDASHHDGILSARELAKMNLEQVDLTVMSACMSGLGYITPDGVYGLQRGLKTAGVKAILSTLWSVDDEATSLFVIQLYRNLEAGMSLHSAFWAARDALKKYEKTYGDNTSSDSNASGSYTQRRRITIPKFNKPYFYNAFILIDGLE